MTSKKFEGMSDKEMERFKAQLRSDWGRYAQSKRKVKRGGFQSPEVRKKALEARMKNSEAKQKENPEKNSQG